MIPSLSSVNVQQIRLAFGGGVRMASSAASAADVQAANRSGDTGAAPNASASSDSSSASASGSSPASGDELTSQEQRLLAQLRQIDRQVRAHEQAHMAAGSGLVRGGVSFSYQTGPDEKRYAVGGEVSIDVTRASTPQETLVKARQIRAAALAPADPSAQDQNVAAHAASMESEALVEIAALQREAIAARAAGESAGAEDAEGARFYRRVESARGAEGASAGSVDVYA